MTDVYEQDKQRFLGFTQDAAIAERIRQDLVQRAAAELEAEKRAQQQARADALSREAAAIASADAAAVEKLAALPDLYAQREDAARQAIDAIASLWRIETELRAGLNEADRIASSVEHLIEPTQRGARRSALRERAGLDARHVFTAPKSWINTDAQRVGAVAVAGITSGVIGPGFVRTSHDVIDFEF